MKTQGKESTAETVVNLLGGQSALARQLELPTSTVGYWLSTGSLPSKWQGKILALAKSKGIPLQPCDFIVPCIPQKVGNICNTGPCIRNFSVAPAPIPIQEVQKGLFLAELLKLSETNTVICFVGVGSAFAKKNDQTSLIIAKNRKTILVDLGQTINQALFRNGMDATDFDYYHLTHAHCDHTGGVEELLLKNHYVLKRKAKIIISPQFESVLWEHTLKGGCQINEYGMLKFRDLIDPIVPDWVKNQPRETYQINVDGIHLTIFRTIHTPGDVGQWEEAFWSTGLIIDGQVLFSGDTRFDKTLFTDLDLSQIESIFHDCQLFTPGNVHAPFEELATLPDSIKEKMYLTHYGDNYESFDPKGAGFAGFARPFAPYCFKQR